MTITVNGETRTLPGPFTVADLLAALAVKPGAVAVERNLTIVDRARFAEETLCEGDTIEIIRMVGGG